MLLNYITTYPNDGIVYRASNMVLCAHAHAEYFNETRSQSKAGAHIYLLEDDPTPRFNGAVLTIATVIKFAMALADCCLRNGTPPANPHRNGVVATMQPYQTDNSAAVGFTN
jgi:hypothetical protein